MTAEKQTRPSAALSVPPATCRARTCVLVAPSQFGEVTHVVEACAPRATRGGPPGGTPPPGMLWVRDPARPAPPLAPRPGPDPACKPSRVKSSFVVSGVCSSSDEFAAERRKDAQHRSTLQQGPGRRRSCGEEMLDRVLSALTLSLHSRGAEGTR